MASTQFGLRLHNSDLLERLARSISPLDLHHLAGGNLEAIARIARNWRDLTDSEGLRGEALLDEIRRVVALSADEIREHLRLTFSDWRWHRSEADLDLLGRYLEQAPRRWERVLRLATPQVTELARRGDLRPLLPRRVPSYRPGDLLPGTDYVLEGYLGGGGFSEVYLVRPCWAPESPLSVVKVFVQRDARLHAQHEARVLGVLSAWSRGARGLLPVRYVSSSTGTPYVLFDYIDALTLEERLQLVHWLGGRVPEHTVIDIVRQAADVLGVAHKAGWVHRDIKAGNFLLDVRHGGHHEVHLFDWGIGGPVRNLTPEEWCRNPAMRRIIDRLLLYACTPEFASPQQRRGPHLCGPEDDVFSLGGLAIQALTGVQGQRVESFDWVSLLRARRVSDRLIRLLADCVSEDPRQRPQDAATLSWRLTGLARG